MSMLNVAIIFRQQNPRHGRTQVVFRLNKPPRQRRDPGYKYKAAIKASGAQHFDDIAADVENGAIEIRHPGVDAAAAAVSGFFVVNFLTAEAQRIERSDQPRSRL